MTEKLSCVDARGFMADALSADIPRPCAVLEAHLRDCPACRAEYDASLEVLGRLREAAGPDPAVPDELWETLERRLADQPQEAPRRMAAASDSQLGLALAQYAYIVLLGMGIWVALVMGQPLFTELAMKCRWLSDHWLILEYGLFILFFSLGGFVAILAAPILIHVETCATQDLPLWKRWYHAMAGTLRLMAC